MTSPLIAADESLFTPFVQDERPRELAETLGIDIHNPAYLRTALTHRSILHEWGATEPERPLPHSNERLEFLGDAYLGMFVAEELFHHAPEAQEGDLTSWRVALVRAERLAAWARELRLGDYLYLGTGEKITESPRDRILSGAFEALIGAIALDGGLDTARDFVLRYVRRDLGSVISHTEHPNPKGHLQELLQDHFRLGPNYRIVDAAGPDHARVFTAEVSFRDHTLGRGEGASKRDAEQAAAVDALAYLDTDDTLSGLGQTGSGIIDADHEQRR